ncbi:DUF4215 domain-containing protein [Chondromyces apiculatus]|uniref:PE-PGRS family protein n=1 Tax=Chondromyces apiculatus DSM 436 TaxID=1192034 RepID=A0A017TEL7_9BACT|nr:DUF4215 domain-containing protein [Chondromyces apiculatus]EYF07738.1 PE-PGRS family protein [Chondromyces apiculatus DSM 436]
MNPQGRNERASTRFSARFSAANTIAASFAGAAVLAALVGGCDGEDDGRLPPPSATGGLGAGTSAGGSGGDPGVGGSGGSGTGGEGAGEGGSGGAGGAGGAGDGGAGGSVNALCGDGVREGFEECDGGDLGAQTCQSLGYDEGDLACATTCSFDLSACSSAERCADAIDNDLDGATDCDDADCAAACAAVCAAPGALSDPDNQPGTTVGQPVLADPLGCFGADVAAVAYEVTAASTGMLEVEMVASTADLTLAVRTSCDVASSEVGCVNLAGSPGQPERLSIPVTQGQTLYVLVGGEDPGTFGVSAFTRTPACGDGYIDTGEACDDGNTVAGDGCNSQCMVELTEVEPNDTAATATPLATPFFGVMGTLTDVDHVRVTVPTAGTSLVVEVSDVNAQACVNNQMDPEVAVLNAGGTTVLASDDDSGPGFCARAVTPALAAGQYVIRVQRAGGGLFPYRLGVTMTQAN